MTGQLSRPRRHERGAGAGGRQLSPRRNRALKEDGTLDAERRSFNRWALAPSLIVLFLIAVAAGDLPAGDEPDAVSTGQSRLRDRLQRAACGITACFRAIRASSIRCSCRRSCRSGACCFRCCWACCWRCCCIRQSRFVEFARTFFLIPMVLPPIVVAVIWKLIYTPDISPLYYAAGLLHLTMPSLTSSVDFALIVHHHRRHLGVAALHLPDGAGGAANDSRGIFRGCAGRRRQPLPDILLRHAALHHADPGDLGDVPPDRQRQSVSA